MSSFLDSFTEVGKMGREVWDKLLALTPPSPPTKVQMISTPTRSSNLFYKEYNKELIYSSISKVNRMWNRDHLLFPTTFTVDRDPSSFSTRIFVKMVHGDFNAKVEWKEGEEKPIHSIITTLDGLFVEMKKQLTEAMRKKNEDKETEADRSGVE